jgi:voltage-gated potassium channel Kch
MGSKLCNAKLALPRLVTWLIRRGSTGDLQAEFKANRELIEAIASALFDRISNVETAVISIFSKHVRRGRFGRIYSARRRLSWSRLSEQNFRVDKWSLCRD